MKVVWVWERMGNLRAHLLWLAMKNGGHNQFENTWWFWHTIEMCFRHSTRAYEQQGGGLWCVLHVSSIKLNSEHVESRHRYHCILKYCETSLLTSFPGLTFGTGLGMNMYTWSEHVGSPCCAGGWPHVSISPWALAAHSNYLWPGSACRRDTTTR